MEMRVSEEYSAKMWSSEQTKQKPLSIQKIKIQPNEVIVSSMFGIHPIGHLSAVGSYNVTADIIN